MAFYTNYGSYGSSAGDFADTRSKNQPLRQGTVAIVVQADTSLTSKCRNNPKDSFYPVTQPDNSHTQLELQLAFGWNPEQARNDRLRLSTSIGNIPSTLIPELHQTVLSATLASRMSAVEKDRHIGEVCTSLAQYYGLVNNVVKPMDEIQNQTLYCGGMAEIPTPKEPIFSGDTTIAYFPSPNEMAEINAMTKSHWKWHATQFCGMLLRRRSAESFIDFVNDVLTQMFFKPSIVSSIAQNGNVASVTPYMAGQVLIQSRLNQFCADIGLAVDLGFVVPSGVIPDRNALGNVMPFSNESCQAMTPSLLPSTDDAAIVRYSIRANHPVIDSDTTRLKVLDPFMCTRDGTSIFTRDGSPSATPAGSDSLPLYSAIDGATMSAVLRMLFNLTNHTASAGDNVLLRHVKNLMLSTSNRDFWNQIATFVGRSTLRPRAIAEAEYFTSGAMITSNGDLSNVAYKIFNGVAQPDMETIKGHSVAADQEMSSQFLAAMYCLLQHYSKNYGGICINGSAEDTGSSALILNR
ncbi:MAG: hypothetical protein JSS82_12505 [Bacteroidetes bacterium]|nr:hypothetical protein [Bacteroidota bacterium]